MAKKKHHGAIPFSMGMVLVTMGVVYGDIGTSPMYTLRAIMHGNGGLNTMEPDVVIGALSLIIWTMTLITTVKYVLVAMKADNHNEGGIFALYSLVRHCGAWLIGPAMVGGAALLADGILTPAVTVTTAIEGLRTIDLIHEIIGDSQAVVIAITIAIICMLFLVQRAGTSSIGRAFGPIMCLWFGFLGVVGVIYLFNDLNVLRAFNPLRGIMFLFNGNLNQAGLMVLGNVFLCTTGAEALYSDMGHVGKKNIYASWPVVKACLIANYLGQGAWILSMRNNAGLAAMGANMNPFFEMLPGGFRIFAVILSTLAAIIASQALITGSFSIVSEAISLDLMPHMKIEYPSQNKGQLYIPMVNNILWIGCVGVVLFFRSSERMEAAYGLAITVTMLMTTILLTLYLARVRHKAALAVPFALFFGVLESFFFFSSLTKFTHGGYVTVFLAFAIFIVMYVWHRGTQIEMAQRVNLPVANYVGQLRELSQYEKIPYMADNLVFLTNDPSSTMLDRDILYSILDKQPKRAKAYWFLNVAVTDEPDTHEFWINDFGTDFLFKVQLRLGFHVNQRVNEYLYQIISTMVQQGRLPAQDHRFSIYERAGHVGDFRFCLVRKVPSDSNDISSADLTILKVKYFIRGACGSPDHWYGLENSSVMLEYVPLFVATKRQHKLSYVPMPTAEEEAEEEDSDE
ncbi:MAG: KUP/HAK/KT family potassium transporter [Coriobacteriales bacterium]|nr:KUP/HAK/KT family potassium transporter [Coriobacteriales bacterium]